MQIHRSNFTQHLSRSCYDTQEQQHTLFLSRTDHSDLAESYARFLCRSERYIEDTDRFPGWKGELPVPLMDFQGANKSDASAPPMLTIGVGANGKVRCHGHDLSSHASAHAACIRVDQDREVPVAVVENADTHFPVPSRVCGLPFLIYAIQRQ